MVAAWGYTPRGVRAGADRRLPDSCWCGSGAPGVPPTVRPRATTIDGTFSDTMSGARDDRPGLAALMEYVREGDAVVVWKLDRLGATRCIFWRLSRCSPIAASPWYPSPTASTPPLQQGAGQRLLLTTVTGLAD
jgi:resolvase-like protein